MLKEKVKKLVSKFNIYTLIEDIFLITVGVYLSFLVYNTTPLRLDIADTAEETLFVTLRIMVDIKLIATLIRDRDRKETYIYTVLAAVAALMFFFSYESTGYTFLTFIPLITLGMIGTDYKKAARYHSFFLALSVGIIITLGLGGLIENYDYLKDGVIRCSWGISYPTDFAAYCLYLVVTAWIGWEKISDLAFLLFGGFVFIISYFVTYSVTGIICSTLFILLVVIHIVIIKNENKKTNAFKKLLSWLFSLAFPLLGAFFFAVMYLYRKNVPLAYKINHLMSTRILHALNAYNEHGITAFGTAFDQIGAGGSTFHNEGYNFVDSSYPLIMIRYGAVIFIILAVYWSLMARKASRLKDFRLMLGFALLAFHSVSEHHFIEFNYNVFITLPFAVLGTKVCLSKEGDSAFKEAALDEEKSPGLERKLTAAYIITAVALIAIGAFTIPAALSVFRTWGDITHLLELEEYGMQLICEATGALLLMIAAMIIAVFKLVKGIVLHKNKIIPAAVIACGILGLFGAYLFSERVITRPENDQSAVMEPDREAVEAAGNALKESGGRIYSNILPELYDREYGFFSKSVFDGQQLAGFEKTTVLMPSDFEANVLLGRGFLYTDISENHAFYSNDEKVIEALEKAGYHFTGYYAKENTVDYTIHQVEALRAGVYTVHYELSIPKDSESFEASNDTIMCKLAVNEVWDSENIKEERLTRADFGLEGKIERDLKCYIPEGRAIGIRMYRVDGNDVIIDKITFRKTPDIDVHKTYDNKGRVILERYFDLEGNPYMTSDGCYGCEYGYDSEDNRNHIVYLDEEAKPMVTEKGFAELRRTYNFKNQIAREEYYDADGKRAMLLKGYSAVEYSYDDEGNASLIRYFDGKTPVMIRGNYASTRRTFDDDKNVVREEFFDTEGKPVLNSSGYSAVIREYDEEKNVTLEKVFGTDGKLTVNTSGYATVKREYNEDNKLIRETYLGTDESILTNSSGYGVVEYEYDEYGNRSDSTYINASGWKYMLWGQYNTVHVDFNGKNLPILETYFDNMGRPARRNEGYMAVIKDYDDEGHLTKMTYADADGNPVIISSGYSIVKKYYNDENKVIKEEYCDTKGKLTYTNQGYASVTYAYNENGNQTDYSYFDTEGKAVLITNGYANIHRDYDEFGQIIREEYTGINGKPVKCKDGYTAIERKYNSLGQLIREDYLDRNGKPVLCTGEYAAFEREYDSAGNIILTRYYDGDNNLTSNNAGYAILRRSFDEGKRILKESYFSKTDRPINCNDGFSVVEYTYNKNGNRTSTVYYNAYGKKTAGKDGYAELVRTFDAKNHAIKDEYFDKHGKPYTLKAGYASIEYTYDMYDNQTGFTVYDAEGKETLYWGLFATVERKFDKYHKTVREDYLDTDGNPCLRPEGFAAWEREYDDQGYLTEERYLDLDGKVVKKSGGYAILRREYDEKHNQIKELYFDENDNPVNCDKGYSEVEYIYNEKNERTDVKYYDIRGKEVVIEK